ncbi:MAG: hybrid sensor histidine kinase/response regulator, partial [Candidatus Eisenbacteria bacterium]|nr:hybrid sensor histidine kinase/response regulator [Candidatus Eisenbacteria bacterium]
FDPGQVVLAVRDLLQPIAQERGIRLEAVVESNLPPLVLGDPARLRQVLINLVGNAVKFTADGEVAIHANYSQEPATTVGTGGAHALLGIEVHDTGVGIPPEKLAAIFDNFTQADATVSRRFGGTGLGLAITRRIAQALGGDVRVESELGRGSTFTIDIMDGATDLLA